MSSLLPTSLTNIAAQASPVGGDITSGAVARQEHDVAAMKPSEVSMVSSGTTYKGGKRRRRSSKKIKKVKKTRKSNKRRRSYRRPMFLL